MDELSDVCTLFWNAQADVDQNGIIDYGEFIAATISLNKVSQQENLHIAFQYFDRDNSGYITKDELQQACVEHHLKDVQVDDMIKELDKDNVSICIKQCANMNMYLSFVRT